MKENFDSTPGPVSSGGNAGEEQSASQPNMAVGRYLGGTEQDSTSSPKVDWWVALNLLARRWVWLILGGLLGAAGIFYLAEKIVQPKFTASAQLLRFDTSAGGNDIFKNQMSAETFSALIRSPDLLRRVGEQAKPPIPPEQLFKCIRVDPDADSDMVKVLLAARTPQQAVDLLNIYLKEAVEFAKEFQSDQAARLAKDYLTEQVGKMDKDLNALHSEFRGLPAAPDGKSQGTNSNSQGMRLPSMQVMKLRKQLEEEYDKLNDLSRKFTDLNPLVAGERQLIKELEVQIAQAQTNTSLATNIQWSLGGPPTLSGKPGESGLNPEADIIRMKLLSLQESRVQLANRLYETQLYATNPPGLARIFAPATMKTVKNNMRGLKISFATIFGGGLGTGTTLMLIFLIEATDRRLRTADDLKRVTKLPVLTTLGDLTRMSPEDRSRWAFRTWTMLQGKLSRSANHGLICGITSSQEGEGRSTWINLLAEAASMTGFRVLTIATRPSSASAGPEAEENADYETREYENGEQKVYETPDSSPAPNPVTAIATKNVLSSPAQVTEQLTGSNPQPVVHIPLPGWVWNLERRKQWRDALSQWRKIENLVILVELPPASLTEAVLLGCNLPNMVWLADSGVPDAAETRAQLDTLRNARCNIVGAVLNRCISRSLKSRFPRWVECTAVAMLLAAGTLRGQTVEVAAAAPPENAAASEPAPNDKTAPSFSIVRPSQRAAWQQHLTLGPGDVLNLGLYGQPDLARTDITIAPDGMVNYLEATNVLATGLTVDEFRAKLDEQLALYRRAPRSMVTPVAFHSKKYFVLGKVMTKGVYTLDRPITVLEAIARAHGLENGLVDRNVVDLADFDHSFLVRGGKRFSLDFDKLFQQGDLSQNIAIEPGDYLYFPARTLHEVYVVGEVRLPGTVVYTPDLNIIAAISARGGYTDRAYKARVLVVRGSLNNPERIAVDTHAILTGKGLNFKLQPKDIIYVNSRPFIRVEELADLAATAFIQSIITSWVGVDVVKPIQGQ